MESLHNLRSVAQSASLILSYYLSLSQPPAPASTQLNPEGNPSPAEPPQTPLDALFATRTSREGRARLAIILRRLSTLAKDVVENASAAASNAQDNARDSDDDKGRLVKLRADVDKAIRIRDEVEKYAERFEKECLRLFDRSYRKGDVRMMAVSLSKRATLSDVLTAEVGSISIAPRYYKTSIIARHAYRCMSTSTTFSFPKTRFWKRPRVLIRMEPLERTLLRWRICKSELPAFQDDT